MSKVLTQDQGFRRLDHHLGAQRDAPGRIDVADRDEAMLRNLAREHVRRVVREGIVELVVAIELHPLLRVGIRVREARGPARFCAVRLVGGDQDLLGSGRLGIVEEEKAAAAGVRDLGAARCVGERVVPVPGSVTEEVAAACDHAFVARDVRKCGARVPVAHDVAHAEVNWSEYGASRLLLIKCISPKLPGAIDRQPSRRQVGVVPRDAEWVVRRARRAGSC